MAEYAWDDGKSIQLKLVDEILGTQVRMTFRRAIAAFYATRVRQRTNALDLLFRDGLYVPAMPVVRAAYEDWITCAWTLTPGDDTRSMEFDSNLGAEYTRLFRRFTALCGKKAAHREFPEHPDYAEPFLSDTKDPPHNRRDWRDKAVELGLEQVHDVAYNHLSDLSHGSFHAFGETIGVDDRRFYERSASRDPDREQLPALWAFWFQIRTLTLAAREWGIDHEPICDAWLSELSSQGKQDGLATCVMKKERYSDSEGGLK